LLHRATTVDAEPDVAATLLVFFAIILLGGLFQALFGLMRWGSLIKFAPHPVMAGFQNMAAVLLFLVQLGNVTASIDALLCAKLTSQPGELRTGDDSLPIRLGIANAVSASFGGITNGINIGPSLTNRAFGGRSWLSVIVNAAAVLAAAGYCDQALVCSRTRTERPASLRQHDDPATGELGIAER
jgi:MFS superfamily sulfate permease-like transporter